MATNLKHVRSVLTRVIIFVRDPCLTRGRVIVNLIPWSNRRARARVDPLIFCNHCFDCHAATLSTMRAVSTASPLINALARTRSI